MAQFESGHSFNRPKTDQKEGDDMPFDSFEAQAAFNKLHVTEQRMLGRLTNDNLENLMQMAFKKPRGILDIDKTLDEFGIPRRVEARTEDVATKEFKAFHNFLLNAILVRDERLKEQPARRVA